jgi:GNAT superfamily N-acetyltransferase
MVKIKDVLTSDNPQLADLLSKVQQQPVSKKQIERMASRGLIWRPRQAVQTDGRMVGVCLLSQSESDGPGRYAVHIYVDPEQQRQGIGSALYEDVLAFAKAKGLSSFYAFVFENRPGGVEFTQEKGFVVSRQTFHASLDVASFDERPFIHHLTQNETNGIQFTTLAELGDTTEHRRLLYELNKTCSADIPGRGPFFTFAEYVKVRFESPAYRPNGVILALDGEKWTGLSAAMYHQQGNFVFNEMTGVLPAYRRRGIALALKLLAVRFARAIGAAEIRTFNDSMNQPMLGVNEQMGYKRSSTSYTMEIKFND